MKIISVFNIKGGVGKTATTVNLAYLASKEKGSKVLLADLDPQGASSFYFKIEVNNPGKKLVKGNKTVTDLIVESGYPNLDLLPADNDYRKIDFYLKELKGKSRWLSTFFKPVGKDYDYVIVDCPPNISLMSENILKNSDLILVPVVPTTLSVRTFEQLMDFCRDEGIDKKKVLPFFSMYERRKNLHNETIEEFSNKYKNAVDVAIPYISEIERMGVYKAPYVSIHPDNDIAYLYKQLWKSVKKKLG
ncbi:MAG TPA: AAA family ATPase [Flavobacteriales bacterium]|nr:AAA family ATPase [Flavobacteriales bacterium]